MLQDESYNVGRSLVPLLCARVLRLGEMVRVAETSV